MDYRIFWSKSAHTLIVKTTGTMEKEDFIKMAKNIIHDSSYTSGDNIIFDHTTLDFSKASLEDLQAIRSFHKENEEKIGNGKSAIVVKPGLSQKWNELWDQGQKIETSNQVGIFESFDKAICWIK